MKNQSSWMLKVMSLELRKIFAYRFDFWIQFVMSVFAHVGVAYFLWKAIFEYKQATSLQGFSFKALMFYYMMVPLINRIVLGHTVGNISKDIYDGSLTKYLIYPVSFFKYKYLQFLATTIIFYLQIIITTILFAMVIGIPSDITFSIPSFCMGIVASLFASSLAFAIISALELIAFWADNVWSLLVMVRFAISLLGGAMIPLSFFPESFIKALKYLPFRFLASFPINSFLGKIEFYEWWVSILIITFWLAFFLMITKYIWFRGKFQYTGVGI